MNITSLAALAALVTVNFGEPTGSVKPVNGVGQPPQADRCNGWSMMHFLKDAGIPYSRLHDVGGWLGGGLFVDIPCLFRNFDADENDPANYTFAYTDDLMKALVANGVEPFFRLGITIENFVQQKSHLPRVNSNVPKDAAKWARICEHVIRHYTEGWANGHKMKIDYWEIWNEPENDPILAHNPMWSGDWKSFCDFYGTVAPYLKSKFPHLKIGGYASCGFYAGAKAAHEKGASISPRAQYHLDCAREFLALARDNRWPLDFFSYHSYSKPVEALQQVKFADDLLNSYGFTRDRTERIFNEWLPRPRHESLGTAMQASMIAAELIGLQNGPCDLACIYDARCSIGSYSPLFNPMTLKPHKAYYAFVAFNELRKCGTAVKAASDNANAWVSAATGNGGNAIMLANFGDAKIPLSFDLGGKRIVRHAITDDSQTHVWHDGAPTEIAARSFIIAMAEQPRTTSTVDSDTIERRIAAACADGSRTVTLAKNDSSPDGAWWLTRAILLPDDFTLVLDGCRLEQAWMTQDNMIRNAGAKEGNCKPNRGIRILGRNGATLSMGTRNNYAPKRSGDCNGWRSVGILLCDVSDYEIGGLKFEETQCWAISQERCHHARVHDIEFGSTARFFNQDGVDLRKGCHDIVIENITGSTGDDTVALTACRDAQGSQPRYGMQIGGNAWMDEADDVYNVTIRNIHAKCAGGHGIVRLLACDGIKMHHIAVEDVVDTATGNDKRPKAAIRIGDVRYHKVRHCQMGEMHHVSVRNVRASGKAAVWLKGPLCDSEMVGITPGPGGSRYDITAPYERVSFE